MSTLTMTLTGWGSKLSELATVVKPKQSRPRSLDAYFVGEFRAYGLSLVRAQASRDHSRGIANPHRVAAAEAYLATLEDVAKAYELPQDGGMYGGFLSRFKEGSHTRSEWIEMTEVEADAALLMYCSV
jgi:hypothetical protein